MPTKIPVPLSVLPNEDSFFFKVLESLIDMAIVYDNYKPILIKV